MHASTSVDLTVRDWKWRLLLVGLAFVLAGALLGATITTAAYGPSIYDSGLAVVLVVGVVSYMVWSLLRDGIREVGVSADGVAFRTGRQVIAVPWSELRPPKYPLFWGDMSFYFPEHLGPLGAVGTDRGRLAVTRRQALAIFTHPSRPRWQTAPEVLRSLRLDNS